MEFKELVQTRRSCRAFAESQPISNDTILSILKDTQMAPSWKNTETGRYYVANTPELIEKVYACLPGFNQKSTAGAGAFLVTTFVKGVSGFNSDGEKSTSVGDEWGAYDLGCQASYLLLSARNHGYDTLIMGLTNETELRKLFSIPEEEIFMAVIALGKRSEEPVLRPRKDVTDIVKFF